ncbi:hypothetical protein [Methylobacterium sp. J-070]|uniref:hypothetical protein n=1 Tax=Methylobacterium sp. J-070 TaxID=2836650 RepID=UPI001FBB9B47|nr:hypothetical protein [Methylobacterium sp. J-070]MCJ2052166.1 hypothetical protein [Methylobacterium sp. J-070]
MRARVRIASALILAGSAGVPPGLAAPGTAAPQPPIQAAPAPPAAPPPAGAAPTPPQMPAAGPVLEQPCGAQAARFESAKGFRMVIIRAGQIRTTNPLRPLTPELNEVLQVVLAGKAATAYGPDFTTLRRGSAPAAIEAMLGGPIRWEAALPTLPDPIAIVSEDGTPLAQLAFKACEPPPAVKAPKAEARKKAPARRPPPKAAEKTPPGFSLPQGAIAE